MKGNQQQIKDFKIDLSYPTKKFQEHLDLEYNQRIIVSGPFGSGKTYFLKDFFNQQQERYVYIRLAPVNYSIAQNEDIFELIKFDILFHLLSEGLFPKDVNFSKEFLLKHLSLLDPYKGLIGILQKATQTGADSLTLLNEIQSVLNGTKNIEIDTENSLDLSKLTAFLNEIPKKPGGIYENNTLTQLLY